MNEVFYIVQVGDCDRKFGKEQHIWILQKNISMNMSTI